MLLPCSVTASFLQQRNLLEPLRQVLIILTLQLTTDQDIWLLQPR